MTFAIFWYKLFHFGHERYCQPENVFQKYLVKNFRGGVDDLKAFMAKIGDYDRGISETVVCAGRRLSESAIKCQ